VPALWGPFADQRVVVCYPISSGVKVRPCVVFHIIIIIVIIIICVLACPGRRLSPSGSIHRLISAYIPGFRRLKWPLLATMIGARSHFI